MASESNSPTPRDATASRTRQLIVPGTLLLLFLFSIVVLWRDFTSPWGLLARTDSYWVARERVAPLVIIVLAAALAAGIMAYAWRGRLPSSVLPGVRRAHWPLIAVGVALSALALWSLRAFANSGDEYDYVFQAQTFLHGRLWNPLLPGQDLMSFHWILEKDGKWITQYPPGWPLLLAAAHLVGIPFAVCNLMLGTVLLVALYQFCRQQADEAAAAIAVALVALSAFFAFNAASYFDHIPSALFGVLFCHWGARFVARPSLAAALLAGVALGALGLIRPYDVLFFSLPFAVTCLIHGRARHYRCAIGVILGGLPFLAALLLYDWLVTGHALLTPNLWGYPSLRLGWPSVAEFGHVTGGLEPLRMAEARLVMLAEWTSPILLIGYGAAFAWKAWRWQLRFYDLVFPLNVAAYLLFPAFGGNQYGPRYYFDSFPFAAVTVAIVAAQIIADTRRPLLAAYAAGIGAAHTAICCAGFIVLAFLLRGSVDERMDLYDQVHQLGLKNAVVVVRSGTGVTQPMDPHDLTRNGLTRDGAVIYTLDVPQRMPELRRLFPGRTFFIYEHGPTQPHGELIPLDNAAPG